MPIHENPTKEERHQLLQESLERARRPEDFINIVNLLSPPAEITQVANPSSLSSITIGIIGAGLAGLSAAYELRKLGANITIYDAEKNRVGGRVYTHYFDYQKLLFGELGAMRIPVSHETTWHYINLFNLNTESLSAQKSNPFIYANNIRMRRNNSNNIIQEYLYPMYDLTEDERNTPWDELTSYAVETTLNNLSSEQRSEILKILPQYSEEYASVSKMSAREIFEMLGLSQGFINLLNSVDPFTSAFLNLGFDETLSGSYTLDFLNTYRIVDGMVKLPMAFYNSLANKSPKEINLPPEKLGNVKIKLGHIVNGITFSPQMDKINIRYINPNNTNYIESFDYVICSIPYTTLREIELKPYFSTQKMQAIKEFNYIDAQKTLFYNRIRFWEENKYYGNINGGISFTDLPIQSIIYPPDHIKCEENENCSYTEPGVLLASYNLGQDSTRLCNQNPNNRFNLIKQNVAEVHGLPPEYIETTIQSYKTVHWNNEEWARGAFASGYPEQKINFAYSMLQPEFNNRIFFAGEHTSTKPGWMQGALYTGKDAANKVALQALSLNTQ